MSQEGPPRWYSRGQIVGYGIDSNGHNVLSPGTAILPNVPGSFDALLGSHSADLRACNTLVVPIVPLPNVLGNLDFGATLETVADGITMRLPRQWIGYAKIEQFKRALGSFSWRDVTNLGCLVFDCCLSFIFLISSFGSKYNRRR